MKTEISPEVRRVIEKISVSILTAIIFIEGNIAIALYRYSAIPINSVRF